MEKRLVYVSRVADAVRVEDAEGIALEASQKNAELGVTGFLIFSPRWFVQVLEGEASVVDTVFARIEKDRRHEEVCTVGEEPITSRAFGQWAMGFAHRGRLGEIDPERWTLEEAMALLQELSGDA